MSPKQGDMDELGWHIGNICVATLLGLTGVLGLVKLLVGIL